MDERLAENTIHWRKKKRLCGTFYFPRVEDQAQRKNDANLMLNDGNDYENGLFCRTPIQYMVWTFINGRVFGTCRFRFRYLMRTAGIFRFCFYLYLYYYIERHQMFGFQFRVWFSNFI